MCSNDDTERFPLATKKKSISKPRKSPQNNTNKEKYAHKNNFDKDIQVDNDGLVSHDDNYEVWENATGTRT